MLVPNTNSTESKFDVQGLNSNQDYVFEVRVVNRYGAGLPSAHSASIRTAAGASTSVLVSVWFILLLLAVLPFLLLSISDLRATAANARGPGKSTGIYDRV